MEETTIERSQDPAEPGRQELKITGSLTICQAASFRQALLEGLAAGSELRVDLSRLSEIDLSGLQLLCSAHQSAEQAGKRLQVIDGGNEIFRCVAADAGFQRHVGCARDTSNSCIWLEGEN